MKYMHSSDQYFQSTFPESLMRPFSDCVFQLCLVNYGHKFSLVIMKNWFSGWASPTGETHTKAKSCSCIGRHFMPVIQLDSLQRLVSEREEKNETKFLIVL